MRLLWGVLSAGALLACNRPPELPAQQPGPLSVRVLDALSGKPLSGIRVVYAARSAMPAGGPAWVPPLGGGGGERVAYAVEAKTGSDGGAILQRDWKPSSPGERMEAQILFVNVGVDMEDSFASGAANVMASYCGQRPTFCPNATPEVVVGVMMLSGDSLQRDTIFRNPLEDYAGEALVWLMDSADAAGAGRIDDGKALRVQEVAAGAPGVSGPVVVRLRRKPPPVGPLAPTESSSRTKSPKG